MSLPPRSFAVIGLGAFGGTVAKELQRFGNHVIGIDRLDGPVNDFAEQLSQTLVLDARDADALREGGLADCNAALVAMADDLESNVLAVLNLKMLGIDSVWAKAASRSHHRILTKIGADRVIHPEEQMGLHIAQVMHNPLVRDFVSLGNGFHVVNFKVPPSLAGKPLDELDHASEHSLRCLGVMRGTEFIGRDGDPCTLDTEDRLLLLGRRGDLRDFAATL